jgi:hypothetical protein
MLVTVCPSHRFLPAIATPFPGGNPLSPKYTLTSASSAPSAPTTSRPALHVARHDRRSVNERRRRLYRERQ